MSADNEESRSKRRREHEDSDVDVDAFTAAKSTRKDVEKTDLALVAVPVTVEQREHELWKDNVCPAHSDQLEGLPEQVRCKWVEEQYVRLGQAVVSLVCPICRDNKLLSPTTSCGVCGQLFCGQCVRKFVSCPTCKTEGRPSARNVIYEKLFADYPVTCPLKTCAELMRYSQTADHVRQCSPSAKCPVRDCSELVRDHDLQSHLTGHHHISPLSELRETAFSSYPTTITLELNAASDYVTVPPILLTYHHDVLLVRFELDARCLSIKVRTLHRVVTSSGYRHSGRICLDIDINGTRPWSRAFQRDSGTASFVRTWVPLHQYRSSADDNVEVMLPNMHGNNTIEICVGKSIGP
jgi:hypothetical protein